MSVNGKQKGNTWERKVANYLSEHFKEWMGVDQSFRRAIDSGSYFGGKNQKRIETHLEEHQNFGDILTPTPFRFEIECKAYKTPPTLDSLLKQQYKKFDQWIEQAEQDALNSNKDALLIIKFNNTMPFVLIANPKYTGCALMVYHGYYMFNMDMFFQVHPDEWFFDPIK